MRVAVGSENPLKLAATERADGVAAVADGTRTTRGAGPTIPLPEPVANRVRDGGESGPVLGAVYGTDEVGTGQRAAGLLTDGIVDREDALV